jgi:hypothetical protein
MTVVRSYFGSEGARDGKERKDEYGFAYPSGWVENGMG